MLSSKTSVKCPAQELIGPDLFVKTMYQHLNTMQCSVTGA